MLQRCDTEYETCLEGDRAAVRGNDIMEFEPGKTGLSSYCRDAWLGEATMEAAEPKRKKP